MTDAVTKSKDSPMSIHDIQSQLFRNLLRGSVATMDVRQSLVKWFDNLSDSSREEFLTDNDMLSTALNRCKGAVDTIIQEMTSLRVNKMRERG